MKITLWKLAGALALAAAVAPHTTAQASDARPNILLIVADDLGYSDIGAFGGEIATPNLDRLAARGLKMTSLYASPFCSPTRAMLMSGTDNHLVGFGGMAELMTPQQRSQPGYEGFLNERALAFPQLLKDAGYRTYMTGKWHLGVKEEHSPRARGFDRSYAMVNGGASHFDQTGIITFDENKTPEATYREDGKPVKIPANFYSSTFFASRLVEYIDADRDSKQPFFGYLAFTAPHWPLQAPDELIRKYEGKYDIGYDVIRARRLERMKALGIVPADMQAYQGNSAWPKWNALSEEQRRQESRRMAVYAAMVEAMDAEIGRVLAYLEQQKQLDNTVVIFLSDNGADGNTVLDEGATRAWAEKHRDNSLKNVGRPGSFAEYGPGWAQVGSTPFNLYKAFMYEGGISVPGIVVMPAGVRRGQTSSVPAHVTDIAPTLLALAGVQAPTQTYRGRPIAPMRGNSMLPFLTGQRAAVHVEFRMGWELNGRKAMRQGNWKIVQANAPWGKDRWELFDLSKDRAELNDLAASRPDKLKELVAAYEDYRRENGVVEFDGLDKRKGYSNGTSYYQDIRGLGQ
ncbi:Arylsulfatase (plasmid) [Cupriavidus necator H850]|uniref:arylsulfatase n=1 Tax=Cupriavidus necator TaxID=106590 RepID=UPI00129D52DE|nr:arylsulfatase [Cupriavidus necator]KAI3610225.1 Arylsulfatase [Cupriavidus necator H850]